VYVSVKKPKVPKVADLEAQRASNREQYRRKKDTSPELFLLKGARNRCRGTDIPCTITISDIVIPDVCPALGIPLVPSRGKGATDNSPSLDRIVPALGYVPGNVCVISYKANRIKQDATAEELEMVSRYTARMSTGSKMLEEKIS
jgi:hypothetical protein